MIKLFGTSVLELEKEMLIQDKGSENQPYFKYLIKNGFFNNLDFDQNEVFAENFSKKEMSKTLKPLKGYNKMLAATH